MGGPNGQQPKVPGFLQDAFDAFLTDREAKQRGDRGSKSATLETYRQRFKSFGLWAGSEGIMSWDDLRPPRISGYFLALKQRNLSDVSRYDHFLSLHALFAFLDGTLDYDPLKGWSGANFPERNRMRACPSKEEMQRALKTFAEYEKYPGGSEGRFLRVRNEALFRVMVECGLRRGEILGIRLDDIDRMNHKITVRGKTGQRDVFYFESARALLTYLGERSSMKPTPQTDTLFVSIRGEPLTAYALRFTFATIRRRAGLKKFHPHLVRHYGATAVFQKTGSLHALLAWGGWANVRSAMRYQDDPAKKRRQVTLEASPLADL